METILVTQDKSAEDFFSEAKKVLQEQNAVAIKGKGRDTVKAVDVAEMLKLDNAKEKNIKLDTEEEDINGKKLRISTLTIELEK